MIKFTKSFSVWLWKYHKDKYGLISLGHTELLTDEMYQNYLDWCKTDEGKQYLDNKGE